MLDDTLRDQLSGYLGKLKQPIELIATLDDGATSTQLRELLESIAGLHDLVTFRDDGTADRTPSFEIRRTGTDIHVTFAGIPLGHEFTSLVLALLHVGGHLPTVDADVLEDVKNLTGEFAFETYMSLSCQNCPDVVQALNIMAVFAPGVTHTAIDGGVYPDEVERLGIKAVPTVFCNGEEFGQGRMDLKEILAKVDTGSAQRDAARLSGLDPYEVLIVGGGPAGAAAAVYTARKGIRTGILAERFGGQTLDTMGIENFVSVSYTEGPKFAAALEAHVRDYDVDIHTGHSAAKLDEAGADGLYTVHTESGAALQSKTVILATGARWRTMGVPGEEEYRNKGVTFCPHCDGPLFKGKRVAVIGGGNSGAEAAIDLAGLVEHVTVIEFMDTMRADDVLQRKLASLPNVDIRMETQTTRVLGDGTEVTGLEVKNRSTGETDTITVAGVFVQIGLLPNTDWLGGSVALSDRSEIEIDARCATNLPGVFGAGDCTTVPYKQIIVSAGQGATAGLAAFDHLIRTSAPSS